MFRRCHSYTVVPPRLHNPIVAMCHISILRSMSAIVELCIKVNLIVIFKCTRLTVEERP